MHITSIIGFAFLAASHVATHPAAKPNVDMSASRAVNASMGNNVFKRAAVLPVECGRKTDYSKALDLWYLTETLLHSRLR